MSRFIDVKYDTLLEHSGSLYLNVKIKKKSCEDIEVKINAEAPFGWQLRNAAIGFYEKIKDKKECKIKFIPLNTALPVIGEIELNILAKNESGEEQEFKECIRAGTGYVTRWKIIGSFDNSNDQGLDIEYPVEKNYNCCFYEVDGRKYYWSRFIQEDFNCFGYVDFRVNGFNLKDGCYNGISYGKCRIWSDDNKIVNINLSSEKGIKIWINRNIVFAADDIQIDKIIPNIKIKKGWNDILVKSSMICEKPYSGRECGFNMKILNDKSIVERELLFEPM